ncbi:MAG TPA: alpha/beta fold hydrolase [Pirellulaceae bacterium]|nr:alpha/beta fold hydrolase [Pirellulaceae bacterium]
MPAEWRPLYPFCTRYLQLAGARMHYVDEGAGEPLLFVHGNPTWSFYWRNLIVGLRDSHRCVAIDHVGCGLSDKPQEYEYTLARRIDDLSRLVEELDLTGVTLLAHDWGGAIGLGTALRMPERFARIVLFNTGAFPPPFVPWRIAACRIPLLGTLAIRGLNAFARAAISMATEKPERMTPEVRAGLLAPYDDWANRVAIDQFVKDIPFSPRDPTWKTLEQIEAGLPELAVLSGGLRPPLADGGPPLADGGPPLAVSGRPIALFWGMKDWCFRPECLDRFIKHWPSAEVHRFEDCGHYVVEDAHERIVPLLKQFLAPESAIRNP